MTCSVINGMFNMIIFYWMDRISLWDFECKKQLSYYLDPNKSNIEKHRTGIDTPLLHAPFRLGHH